MSRMLWIGGLIICAVSGQRSVASEPAAPTVVSVDAASYLQLTFSEPMLTWAGSAMPPEIVVTPTPSCAWLWTSDTLLTCSRNSGDALEPATHYRLAIGGGLWSQRGREIERWETGFDTDRPSIFEAGALIDHWSDGVPAIDIRVSEPVAAAALSTALVLSEDGRAVPFELTPQKEFRRSPIAEENRIWRIDYHPSDAKPHSLSVRIKPGLRSNRGPLVGVQDDELLRARVNEPFGLRYVRCRNTYRSADSSEPDESTAAGNPIMHFTIECPAGQALSLAFSHPLSADAIAWLRSHLPRGLRYERMASGRTDSTSGHPIRELARPDGITNLVSDSPNSRISFDLPASLTSADGATIVRPYRVTITSTDFEAAYSLAPTSLLLQPGDPLPSIITTANLSALPVQVWELGAGGLGSRVVNLAETPRTLILRRPPPAPSADIRRHGGLAYGAVTLPSNSFDSTDTNYTLNYAAFNITSGRTLDQALVWVTNWNGASPVAGARVELTGSSATSVVAVSETGADGVALFDLSGLDEADASGFSLVRVSRRGQRSILPFSGYLGVEPKRKDRYFDEILHEGQAANWGISDRPLYLPGDRVQYRVWIRERHRNHLRQAAKTGMVRVRVRPPGYGPTMSTFTAMLDAFGSISGSFDVPISAADGDYCISTGVNFDDDAGPFTYSGSSGGACFRVVSRRSGELWATLRGESPILLPGEPVRLDAEARYTVGGPALGARAQFTSLLSPRRLDEAYPRYRGYTFVDPFRETVGDAGETLALDEPVIETIDHTGHAERTLVLSPPGQPLREDEPKRTPIPFGRLDLGVSVSISPVVRSVATTSMTFSRYRRFAGIRLAAPESASDRDPEIAAVVIDASGRELAGTPIEIDIEERIGEPAGEDSGFRKLSQCRVESGHAARCPFEPTRSGLIRFVARSSDAAPALIERTVRVDGVTPVESRAARLTTPDEHPVVGSTITMTLHQPFAKARVLVSIEHSRVLEYRVLEVDSPLTRIPLTVDSKWLPVAVVNAQILDASEAAFGSGASAEPLLTSAKLEIRPLDESAPAPLVVDIDRTAVRPGDHIGIHLHNPRSRPVQVTLDVIDDAYSARAPDLMTRSNPAGQSWLATLDEWVPPVWFGLGRWNRRPDGQSVRSFGGVFAPDYQFRDPSILLSRTLLGSDLTPAELFEMSNPKAFSSPGPLFGGDRSVDLLPRMSGSARFESGFVLEAGADRHFDVALPNDPARWRIRAWANDDADGFTLSEALVDASWPMPVEVAVSSPIYPGDQANPQARVHAGRGATHVETSLRARGAGVDAERHSNEPVGPDGKQTIALPLVANRPGTIDIVAKTSAGDAEGHADARIDVSSPRIHRTVPVAGWITPNGSRLKLPALPPGAVNPRLSVVVGHGTAALVRSWVIGLRDDTHATRESELSRAIGAAVAIRLGFSERDWPDARSDIQRVLQEAQWHQNASGEFRSFASSDSPYFEAPNVMLTAFSVGGREFLASQGYSVPSDPIDSARRFLARSFVYSDGGPAVLARPSGAEEVAAVASVLHGIPPEVIDAVSSVRDRLSWSSRAYLVRPLSARIARLEDARSLLDSLREAGPRPGARRTSGEPAGATVRSFGSALLDQCSILDALLEFDHAADAGGVRAETVRGLADVVDQGENHVDAPSLAQCLMVLSKPEFTRADTTRPVHVDLSVPGLNSQLEIAVGASTASTTLADANGASFLDAHADAEAGHVIGIVATLEYDLDARKSSPSTRGFTLQRRYSVVRNDGWKEATGTTVHEGDWVRVTLRLSTSGWRSFVSVSDETPAGLRAFDLDPFDRTSLELPTGSNLGSPWFDARDIHARHARFVSEKLPPGVHEIQYYARATHAGRYTALPAVAEQTFASAPQSRTAPTTITIDAPRP